MRLTARREREVLARLAKGEGLLPLEKGDPGEPDAATVAGWLADPANGRFAQAWRRTSALRADRWMEEAIALADQAEADSAPSVQKAKLQVEVRRWACERVAAALRANAEDQAVPTTSGQALRPRTSGDTGGEGTESAGQVDTDHLSRVVAGAYAYLRRQALEEATDKPADQG